MRKYEEDNYLGIFKYPFDKKDQVEVEGLKDISKDAMYNVL